MASDDDLGYNMVIDEVQLADLLRRTFRRKYQDNFQKVFALQGCRSGFPVWDKLAVFPMFPRCGQDRETVLHALVECLNITQLITYVEHILLSMNLL